MAQLARQARPWLVAGVVTMLTTGVLLFLSEADQVLLQPGVLGEDHHLAGGPALHLRRARARGARPTHVAGAPVAATGAMSIALWVIVAAGGRWIGFS